MVKVLRLLWSSQDLCLPAATAAVASAFAAAGLAANTALPTSAACGVERWSVKTLTDPSARLVDFRAHRATVEAPRRLHAPSGLGARIRGVETTVYRARARLLAFKLEPDSDIHLVVADPVTGGTMIAEFPSPACTNGAASVARRMMARARASIIRECGEPPSLFYATISGRATVTGVGFFDFRHGQRGVAPNAIELHPVLGFHAVSCGRPP